MNEPIENSVAQEPKDPVEQIIMEEFKRFVEHIVKNLVDSPDKVCVNPVGGKHSLILELSVAQPDIGKVIGKQGKTINAIRHLLNSVGSRNQIRVTLEINEPKAPDAPPAE